MHVHVPYPLHTHITVGKQLSASRTGKYHKLHSVKFISSKCFLVYLTMFSQHQLRGDSGEKDKEESSHDIYHGIIPRFTGCMKESHENHQTG
jgi:hypothetical protein